MKRSSIGIQDIATFENAEDAYRKARRCKRYREEVLRFTENKEAELCDIVQELLTGTYTQGEARRFVVYEPKKRDIYALPFRDINRDFILPMPTQNPQKLISGMCSLPDGGTLLILDCGLLFHE